MTQNKAENIWDQSGFEAFYAALPPERVAEDEKKLSAIFNAAAKASPTFKQELDWAQAHGIRFFIDHTCCTGIGGYYRDGSGVVALSLRQISLFSHFNSARILGHEIRHAWQDYHHLVRQPGPQEPFDQYYANVAFREADAFAFESLVAEEISIAEKTFPVARLERVQALSRSEKAWKSFTDWFSSRRALQYGDRAAWFYGSMLDLGVSKPNDKIEFENEVYPLEGEVGLSSVKTIHPLGESFDGKNYFDTPGAEEFLNKVVDPSLALKFYQASWSRPLELVEKICEKQIQQKQRQQPGLQ